MLKPLIQLTEYLTNLIIKTKDYIKTYGLLCTGRKQMKLIGLNEHTQYRFGSSQHVDKFARMLFVVFCALQE
jgi:hypothetical protein